MCNVLNICEINLHPSGKEHVVWRKEAKLCSENETLLDKPSDWWESKAFQGIENLGRKMAKPMHFQNLPNRILWNVSFGSFGLLEAFENNGCTKHPYHDDCAMCCKHETELNLLQIVYFNSCSWIFKNPTAKLFFFNTFVGHKPRSQDHQWPKTWRNWWPGKRRKIRVSQVIGKYICMKIHHFCGEHLAILPKMGEK